MPPYSIRRATQEDSCAAAEVVKSVYDEFGFTWEGDGYHWDLYHIKEAYDDQGDAFYVAEIDGQIVGTVALERFDTIPGPLGQVVQHNEYIRVCAADCSLERLYVHPSARKFGIGGGLTEHVINLAKEEGRRVMELWSDKRFVDAHRLYGRYGAKVVGERICDDPDEAPEWGLAIEL